MRGIRKLFSRFMEGRYGMDRLNRTLLWIGLVMVLVELFMPFWKVKLVLAVSSYLLVGWVLFRSLSRNTYKRYRENRRFLMLLERLRDKRNRYFSCPRCHQPVRVPRGKGKVSITCPKCKEKFIKKT